MHENCYIFKYYVNTKLERTINFKRSNFKGTRDSFVDYHQ